MQIVFFIHGLTCKICTPPYEEVLYLILLGLGDCFTELNINYHLLA